MVFHRGHKHIQAPSFSIRTSHFIDREFQLKYTSIVLTAAIIGILITIVPVYMFLTENFKVFVDLAYENAPQILDYIERERAWVTIILISGSVGTLSFFWYLGLKFTSRIVGPIQIMKNHLRGLSRGQWNQPPIKIRNNDEFQDLVDAYNYFYDSFRVNLQKDLELLQKLTIDPQNRDAYLSWKQLIEEKSMQLNISPSQALKPVTALNASSPSEQPDQRHVS